MRHNPTFLALGLVIAGCSILAPVETHNRFFTLTAVQGTPMDSGGAPTARGPVVVYGLGPVTLPAYLDRNEIAIRISPTKVRYGETDLWAEQLPTNVAAVLQQDLANLLGTARVVLFPWPRDADVTYQVEIGFNHFDTDTSGQAQLLARWAIKDARQNRYVMLRETALTGAVSPNDTPAAVAVMSTLLGELSGEIATALRQLPPPIPTPATATRR